jgi:hypothetical protein
VGIAYDFMERIPYIEGNQGRFILYKVILKLQDFFAQCILFIQIEQSCQLVEKINQIRD